MKEYYINYRLAKQNILRIPIVTKLTHLAKMEIVYSELKRIYVNDIDPVNRNQAVRGILWHDGYIENIDDLQEYQSKIELFREFNLSSTEERIEYLGQYERRIEKHFE